MKASTTAFGAIGAGVSALRGRKAAKAVLRGGKSFGAVRQGQFEMALKLSEYRQLGSHAVGKSGGKVAKSKPVTLGVVGAAGLLGFGSAIMDKDGAYPEISQNMFGVSHVDLAKSTARANLHQAITSRSNDVMGPTDYYYGQQVNSMHMASVNSKKNRSQPVPGEIVFGMYNQRR